jgi:hypothetical protein
MLSLSLSLLQTVLDGEIPITTQKEEGASIDQGLAKSRDACSVRRIQEKINNQDDAD